MSRIHISLFFILYVCVHFKSVNIFYTFIALQNIFVATFCISTIIQPRRLGDAHCFINTLLADYDRTTRLYFIKLTFKIPQFLTRLEMGK